MTCQGAWRALAFRTHLAPAGARESQSKNHSALTCTQFPDSPTPSGNHSGANSTDGYKQSASDFQLVLLNQA
jgi:hypothetical protein